MKITITKPNEFEVLMEYDLMKAHARDADLLAAFDSIAPRFSEATRQKIDPLTPQQVKDITAHLTHQTNWQVVIAAGITHYGKKPN